MAIDRTVIIGHIQTAVNTLASYRDRCEQMMRLAQPLALEGEKRRNEVFAKKLHCCELSLIKDTYDGFETAITAQSTPITTTVYDKDTDYFTASKNGFVGLYDSLHTTANNLVIANAKTFAEPLYELACEIWKCCIVDIKRRIKQDSVLKAGKSSHHILIFEQTWKDDGNAHDYWESKE